MSHEDYEAGIRDGVAQERARIIAILYTLERTIRDLIMPSIKGESDD